MQTFAQFQIAFAAAFALLYFPPTVLAPHLRFLIFMHIEKYIY